MLHSLDQRIKKIPSLTWTSAYLVLITCALSYLFTAWAYDDPFITYRYAENLSLGSGLVYNPAASVLLSETRLSTTTPLFALLLAALHPLYPNLPHLAVFIGAFSLALGGVCLWDLLSHPSLKFSRWVGLLFYPLFPLLTSTLSSETPLYLALCLSTFTCYRRGYYRLAALFASLAVLARPDAVLVALVLGLHYLSSHPISRRNWRLWFAALPRQAIFIYLSIVLSWLIYAWITYGSPIPLTLFAKQQQALTAGSQKFLPGFLTIVSWYSSRLYQIQALLALPGLVYGLRRIPVLRWLASWTVLYFIAYSLLGVTRYFWYYAPLVPLFIAGFGLGLDALYGFVKRVSTPAGGRVSIPAGVTTIMLIFLLVIQSSKLWNSHLRPDPRFPIYHAVGEWLSLNTPAEATVGTLEVGIIGYYAQRSMVDFSGLIQPAIAVELGKRGSYAAAAYWAIAQYHPDYLVFKAGEFPAVEAKYLPACQLQATFAGETYSFNSDMHIYACP